MTKYRAKPVVIDNIRFHSQREGKRYGELKLLLHTGLILNLEIQRKYPLYVNGTKIGHYIADFCYFENGQWVIEDCKGFRTPLYRWKKKHVEAEYKVQIRET
jgi:Protein of unknown function (DUF1064)